MLHLLHWINDHWAALGDIALVWFAPVFVIYLISRLFRTGHVPYRSAPARIEADERRPRRRG